MDIRRCFERYAVMRLGARALVGDKPDELTGDEGPSFSLPMRRVGVRLKDVPDLVPPIVIRRIAYCFAY